MFGFGREVSVTSVATPMKGIISGIRKYRNDKIKFFCFGILASIVGIFIVPLGSQMIAQIIFWAVAS